MQGVAIHPLSITTGHACWPPTVGVMGAGSTCNVFVNNLPVHCVGDPFVVHICVSYPFPPCMGAIATGSGTVTAGFRPLARMGDMLSDTDMIAVGSPNVYAG